MKEWTEKEWAEMDWLKNALRDYYKPRLKRDLKRVPEPKEVDSRFREIYSQLHFTLLVGKVKGVTVQFHQIAIFTLDEFNGFRTGVKKYIEGQFGGGWFKLNIYHGPTFAVTVNYRIQGASQWEHLLSERS